MKRILKMLLWIMAFAVVLSGCMASEPGETVLQSETGNSQSTDGTEESTEAGPAPLDYVSIAEPYINDFVEDDVLSLGKPLVVRSAEELLRYCNDEDKIAKYNDAYFENNSLILLSYTISASGDQACLIDDLTENGDGTFTLVVGFYAYRDFGATWSSYGGYYIEVNRVLEQEQLNHSAVEHRMTEEEFNEKFNS